MLNRSQLKTLTPGCIYYTPNNIAKWSFPNGPGSHEQRTSDNSLYKKNPNLTHLYEIAREEKVRLHVILLHRSLKDCLVADCVHREFEPCPNMTETLHLHG